MADADIPNFRTYAEGESIPPVDPEDIKALWKIRARWGTDPELAALSPGADFSAVSHRRGIVWTLINLELLAPWRHGEELDDAVFRVAATFPTREFMGQDYMIEGDERFGFDPNAFVRRLVEESGIAHVWKTVETKVPEGKRIFGVGGGFPGQDPDTLAKRQARELVWDIWKRFSNVDELLSHQVASNVVAALFADFLMDNIDRVRQVEASFRAGTGGGPLELLAELERKAKLMA